MEITTGLKAGEQVATTNLTQLVDGVAVAPTTPASRGSDPRAGS
jgi:hypothetical protein